MPSPLPGMDPYIEHREIWPDFHGDAAAEIRARLNGSIQPAYVARLVPYVTYDVVEVAKPKSVYPDVGIYQQQVRHGVRESATDVVITPPPVESWVELEIPLEIFSVEIRSVRALELVTAIEILSPVNKRPGHDAQSDYLRKRRELLRSSAHLIEIVLLRGGQRSPLETPVPSAPYYVTLSRWEERPRVAVWPIQLSEKLPVIPIPLREPDPDVPLDLGAIVASIYERGGYASLIDYHQPPPPPPLSPDESVWLEALLGQAGVR